MGLFGNLFGGGSSLGPLQTRIVEKQFDDISGFVVQCKGLMPVYTRKEIGFVTSILCKDKDGSPAPVLSLVEQVQESLTSSYQHTHEIGEIDGPGGYEDWGGIAVIIPDFLHAAYGGEQTLGVVVRLVDMNDMPSIILGYCARSDVIWTDSIDLIVNLDLKGYREEESDKNEARALSIKLGVAVAFVDDDFDDSEGETLNKWIKKMIAPYSDDRKESLKELYNKALKESYRLERSGKLDIESICHRMNKIADKAQKHEALELANKVMAADTKILDSETKLINHIANLLNIDPKDSEKIRDKQLVNLKPTSGNINVEGLIGIDPTWSNTDILVHIGKEFAKWNGRMNSLQDGEEKDNAQQMLDLIGETRKKYV